MEGRLDDDGIKGAGKREIIRMTEESDWGVWRGERKGESLKPRVTESSSQSTDFFSISFRDFCLGCVYSLSSAFISTDGHV